MAHFQPGGWLKRATHLTRDNLALGCYAIEAKDVMKDQRNLENVSRAGSHAGSRAASLPGDSNLNDLIDDSDMMR